jgi:hypothetical protein
LQNKDLDKFHLAQDLFSCLTSLRLIFLRRGYAEAEIEAVFAKYDVNGDRILDQKELAKMAADLENQSVSSSCCFKLTGNGCFM